MIIRNIINTRQLRHMGIFIQKLNPVSGKMEWQHKEENYDYLQEISNAGFGDMLHDKERNQKYYLAIKNTVKSMHDQGKKVNVLDIGTGTGILSMMAIRAGADTVTACEAFLPMANCAEQIFLANNCCHKVHLIKKRSTDIVIGKDMKQKANLLVTEILDTELIGEGAISIYNHAHEHLLTDDTICIPCKANCYVQIVQLLRPQWNTLNVLANLDGDVILRPPDNVLSCKGDAVLHDVQLSQLPLENFIPITKEPIEIFEFDFCKKQARETFRTKNLVVTAQDFGSANAIFFWWSINMDQTSKVILSCAPKWFHPDCNNILSIPWRDHWMQAIYYIPKALQLNKNDQFILNCSHDEYSWWFDILPYKKENLNYYVSRHVCSCNMHRIYPRSRIGQLNEATRTKRFLCYFEQQEQQQRITENSKVLLLGDGCIIGLAGVLTCNQTVKIWCHESNKNSKQFMQSLVQFNKLNNVEFIECLNELTDDNLKSLTHVISEPYFITSILPWDNLLQMMTILENFYRNFSSHIQIVPCAARIYALPVEFLNLHKIRTPVKECEGFDVKLFDEMMEKSKSLIWSKIEAQPLWEYPCRALATPKCLLNITMDNYNMQKIYNDEIQITQEGNCNGVCLWIDWFLDQNNRANSVISTGPVSPVIPGQFIKWNMLVRQGVCLFNQAHLIDIGKTLLKYSIDLDLKAKHINFQFHIK